ncbi:hypothetical protein AVEN_151413-1 [Araneus ventricosus]|uniref:Uncharacterized protein n=1 Tax=Araneus ventricosus TaxID=182803 RepID=A0A4Y2C944_ARAVE|nr:hypothetical protein AVEN_151413-1 [Araneus ventricosus]
MMRTTPELALPSPSFRTTPAAGRLAPTSDLTCNRPTYTADLQWNRVSNLGPRSQDLTTRVRCLKYANNETLKSKVSIKIPKKLHPSVIVYNVHTEINESESQAAIKKFTLIDKDLKLRFKFRGNNSCASYILKAVNKSTTGGAGGVLSKVCLISGRGNAKNCCCLRVLGWFDRFVEVSVNARTSKASESTDEDLSIVLTDCCRLCTRHGNGVTGRIQMTANPQVQLRATKPMVMGTRFKRVFAAEAKGGKVDIVPCNTVSFSSGSVPLSSFSV